MSDIFLSYVHDDLARASKLAAAFETCGWTVFWDRTIPPGKIWPEVIDGALSGAKCVVVAWSQASIQSDWVCEEAEEGKARKILVPVLLDAVRPPLGYLQIQAATLVDWKGDTRAQAFVTMVNAVAQIVSSAAPPTARPAPSSPGGKKADAGPTAQENSASWAKTRASAPKSRADGLPEAPSLVARFQGLPTAWKVMPIAMVLGLLATQFSDREKASDGVAAKPKTAVAAIDKPENSSDPPWREQPVRQSNIKGPEMINIPAGSFQMGSTDGQPDEQPAHTVELEAFAIGRYEVTFEEYDQFAAATGRDLPQDEGWGRAQRPVIDVSWDDAVAYAAWLSEQTHRHYRLPTEAEWEYVARAGTQSNYWWGDDIGRGRANCNGCGSRWDAKQIAPVGSFAANPWGLHDTVGNVLEWVADCYHYNYQGAPADGGMAWVDSQDCAAGLRVMRGGSWGFRPYVVRCAHRYAGTAGNRDDNLGFRLARSIK